MQKNKIVSLNTCIKEREVKQKRKMDGRYQCIMSGSRLMGFCEILIIDGIYNNAEWFQLYFSTNGMTAHRYLDREEVLMWQYHKNDTVRITYRQALILLGDAVRQNYKYQTKTEWSQSHDSLHIQRIWQKEYYDYNNCSVDWLLDLQEPTQFVEAYFDAITNKDAVLLYDIMADVMKQRISREVYAYSWNHVLEELSILDYDMIYIEQSSDCKKWSIYITIYGGYEEVDMLSIDLCLKLVLENGGLRLLSEQVLDANHISSS